MKILAVLAISACCLPPQQSDSTSAGISSSHLATTRIEGLSESASIVLATNYILNIDPGVTAQKNNDSVTLSTYDGAKIQVVVGSERIAVMSPFVARLTPLGWDFGMGKTYSASALYLSRVVQDDTDSNLKSMQENAKKLKAKTPPPNDPKKPNNNNNQGNTPTHWRLLFSENPMATAELFNAAAIQQLVHLSPIGF
jgi:ABC-type Fe3+-hydroxamate transport system substrate-binding protein